MAFLVACMAYGSGGSFITKRLLTYPRGEVSFQTEEATNEWSGRQGGKIELTIKIIILRLIFVIS